MGLTISVVAAGAMGSAVGARLATHGARVLTSLDGRSEATAKRAEAAGFEAADDAALAAADMILSIVPPDQAVPLAVRFAGPIARSGRTPAYVDLNAISPTTSREVGQALAQCGARYVDGSIIGAPPGLEGSGPAFYLSGPDAVTAASLRQHGLAVKLLEGGIGAASALKMTYAGITKGITALGAAMILAAQREGAAEALAAELGASQKEILARLARAVPDMLPKAYRWVPEMHEIAGFLGRDDPAAGIYRAIALFYAEIARDQAGDGQTGCALQAFFASLDLPGRNGQS